VSAAVALAAAFGHGGESRGASASEIALPVQPAQITCDQLEAIIALPKLLERSTPSVLESTDDQYRLVVPIQGRPLLFAHIEHSDPSIWLRIVRRLRGLRDAVTVDRDEPARVVTLGARDCNQ
jgi:hypothetical protein